jgi:futalosine hydrolase
MKLLLVAATKAEIGPLMSLYNYAGKPVTFGDNELDIIITGVGMTATAYALGRRFAGASYDLAINTGIAGSFDPSITIGEVVLIREDHFAELGAENDAEFLTIDEMGFGEGRITPLSPGVPVSDKLVKLRQVSSITVNTVHGNTDSIVRIIKLLSPQTESMEGAAFFYACNQVNIPSVQLRAISNNVEKRNTANWNIPVAVEYLNKQLVELLESIR